MELGVCYYPEHWPKSRWADDARRMRAIGIAWVRMAEFAWSEIEPEPGRFEWAWLDEAIDTLHAAGLKVVMCTPTATPPKWLVDRDPAMLALDLSGRPRGFGSRRHYCFSSASYRAESRRISRAVAERYGRHPAVQAWQTDNEYGCHDTVLSTSDAARRGFRAWLQQRYGRIEALNEAWGTVFWSQRYRSFDEVDLPVGTVTEAHPSHRLDWRRFASDEVRAFNREQVDILRECSPGRPVSHNFMGFFTEFDHHDVAADLDIATWDSYPLGFTQNFFFNAEEKTRWARTGHPDIPAFHHDLYRGLCADAAGRGRWWVMEQQPGPVNWAQWNPLPAAGMVRLWTWQAFAHGAEVVSYFRWRQAPFAQEQMHAGLLRPDSVEAEAAHEAAQVAAEVRQVAEALGGPATPAAGSLHALRVPARVALVFDYPSIWMAQIQPQGADFNALELAFRCYSALRSLGLSVDVVSPRAALDGYRLVVLPAVLRSDADLAARLAACGAHVVLGPRCASKTATLQIPPTLPPGPLAELAGLTVERVESLPPGLQEQAPFGSDTLVFTRWREQWALRGATAEAAFDDRLTAVARHGRCRAVAGWLDDAGWRAVLRRAAADAGLDAAPLPEGLRIQPVGPLVVACNFAARSVAWQPPQGGRCLVGAAQIEPQGIAVWDVRAASASPRHGVSPESRASP